VAITTSTASTTYQTGALTVAGGVGIAGAVFMNSTLAVAGNLTTNLSQYSVPFVGASGLLSQDNNNFYWNSASHLLSVKTGGDQSGTDSINIYGEYDAYNTNATTGSTINASTVPGFTGSSSRGTGASPIISNTGDIIGGFSGWGYTGASPAYTNLGGMYVKSVGATANNLGGQLEFYTKLNNASTYSLALTIDNTQASTFSGTVKAVVPTTSLESFILQASAGVNPSTPTSGSLWWNGTNLYFYNGSTNKDLLAAGSFTWGTTATGTTNYGLTLTGTSTGSALSLVTATGTGLTGATSDLAGAGVLANLSHTASGTLTAKTTADVALSSSRTYTLTSGSVTDNYNAFTFSRTNVTTGAGGTLLAQGAVVNITGTDTQTAGTLTPSYNLLKLTPSALSTGATVLLSIPNSTVAGAVGQSITIGNTQSNQPITAIDINTGTSTANVVGAITINATNISATTAFSGTYASGAISLNNFTSAKQSLAALNLGLAIGKNFNTGSSNYSFLAYFTNEGNTNNATYNTGVSIENKSTSIAILTSPGGGVGNLTSGAGLVVNQTGPGGTAIFVGASSNVNSSTNGLVNYTLSNTQSGATVMQKIDLGTSAQGHTGLLIKAYGASSTQAAITIDPSTTLAGVGINILNKGGAGFAGIDWNQGNGLSIVSSASGIRQYNVNATTGQYWRGIDQEFFGGTGTNSGIFQDQIHNDSGSGTTYGIYQGTLGQYSSGGTGTIYGWYVGNLVRTNATGEFTKSQYFSLNNAQSANLVARTVNTAEWLFSRTNTATTGTVADNFNGFYFERTNVQNGAGGTLTAAGSVLKLENVATQTAGTLTDTVDGLYVKLSSSSTGRPIAIEQNNITSTHFRKILSEKNTGVTLWVSDGTTPNGALTGNAGDICFNGASSRSFYCTGTTNWTASNA